MEGAFLAASLVDQSRAAITGLETCIFKVWLGFLLAWQLLVFCFAEAQPGELNISQNPKQAQMLHCGTWVPCQEVLGRGYGGGVQLDTQSALGHWDGCDLSMSAAGYHAEYTMVEYREEHLCLFTFTCKMGLSSTERLPFAVVPHASAALTPAPCKASRDVQTLLSPVFLFPLERGNKCA